MTKTWQRAAVLALFAIAAPLAGAADKKDAGEQQIVLTSPAWVGNLKLEKPRLTAIKKAVENALTGPIDAEQQCGDETGLCTVRTAREWVYNGQRYREIVVNVHMVGHASQTVKQKDGVWPSVSIE